MRCGAVALGSGLVDQSGRRSSPTRLTSKARLQQTRRLNHAPRIQGRRHAGTLAPQQAVVTPPSRSGRSPPPAPAAGPAGGADRPIAQTASRHRPPGLIGLTHIGQQAKAHRTPPRVPVGCDPENHAKSDQPGGQCACAAPQPGPQACGGCPAPLSCHQRRALTASRPPGAVHWYNCSCRLTHSSAGFVRKSRSSCGR
jgi:hypothetical protein